MRKFILGLFLLSFWWLIILVLVLDCIFGKTIAMTEKERYVVRLTRGHKFFFRGDVHEVVRVRGIMSNGDCIYWVKKIGSKSIFEIYGSWIGSPEKTWNGQIEVDMEK